MIRVNLSEIVDVFVKAGYEVIIYSTQYPNAAYERVLEYADKVDAIAIAGGDGSLNEVINGIVELKSDTPLFYIPSGSTNDYAATLGISKNQIQAANEAVNGIIRKIDIGRLNGTCFDYVAAFGIFTDISYATDQNLKNTMGYLAYVVEVGKRVFNIPAIEMTIEADGRIYSDKWFYGMITNSTQVGGVKNIIDPKTKLDDGLFEITLVKATNNPIEFVEMFNDLSMGIHSSFVVREKAARIEIRSDEAVPWTIDGEEGGTYTEVSIENINQAVSIAVADKPRNNKLFTK